MNFESATKFGISIPTCAKFEKAQQSKSFMEVYKDEKSYTQSRLRSLNVNLAVKPDIFKMEYRAGFNNKKDSSSSSSMSEFSFLFEQRMFELKIGNYKEHQNHGMSFTEDFTSAVASLPRTYNKGDPSCRSNFERFFNRFGHFLVSSAYVGGSVEVKCKREAVESEETGMTQAKVCLEATLQGLDIAKAKLSADASVYNGSKSKVLLEQSEISFRGGNSAFDTIDTFGNNEKLQKWKDSLLQNPIMLTSELTLEPISTVVGCIDPNKDSVTYDALNDILGCEITTSGIKTITDKLKAFWKRVKKAVTRKDCLIEPD
jgi:hypothetical protein